MSTLLGELRTNEDNKEFRNEPKEDRLDKFVNDSDSDNNIKNLEDRNSKILARSNEYFDNYEENKIELEKKIKESKILNDKLINKKEEIIKELDNKKELINEYEADYKQIN